MKNWSNISALLVCLILLSAWLTSCVKSQVIPDATQQEIAMDAIMSPMTKASVEYTGGPFGVISYVSETTPGTSWTGDALTSATEYFSGKFINKDGVWGGEQPYYWPLGNNYSLIFAGYSPYTKVDGSTDVSAEYNISTKTLTFTDYVVESTPLSQTDLMFFMPETDVTGTNLVGMNKGSEDAVDVLFRHALSQVLFNVTIKPGDDRLVKAGNITLNNVVCKGTCTVSSGNVVTWIRSTEETDKSIYEIEPGQTAMLIPGASYSIEVSYNLVLNGKEFTETAQLDVESTNYAPGYKYIYNIIIGASAITVDTDYKEWVDE